MNVMNQNFKALQGEASEQPDLSEYVTDHCKGLGLEVL